MNSYKRVSEFTSVITGGTPSTRKKEYWNGDIPWLNSGILNDGDIYKPSKYITELGLKNSSARIIPVNSVLIALTGATTGQVGYLNIEASANQSVTAILPSEEHHSRFLYYFLKTLKSKIKNDAFGGAQPHINQQYIKNLLIPLPPLDDQKRIASLLNRAEKLIAQRKESIRLLDELLKSTFLEMFGPSAQGFNTWSLVEIKDLALKPKGSMRTGPFGSNLLHSEFQEKGDVAVLGIDNAVDNTFKWKEKRFITKEKYSELTSYRIFPEDVIITIMGTTGRSSVVPADVPLAINTKHLAAITVDKKKANPYFLSYSFHSNPYLVNQLSQRNRGAIMNGLNLGIIKETKIHKAPIELQNRFAEILSKAEFMKSRYRQSLTELENLYGSVSQKAFKGELDLSRISNEELSKWEKTNSIQIQAFQSLNESDEKEIKHMKEIELSNLIKKEFKDKIFTVEDLIKRTNLSYENEEGSSHLLLDEKGEKKGLRDFLFFALNPNQNKYLLLEQVFTDSPEMNSLKKRVYFKVKS